MPSKSNKNKWSLPPYPPTAETICIPVTVPNDDRWIGLFLGQLYRLSQQIWYDRDEQHTAKLVAAVWSDIYLETVKRVWGCGDGGGMFDVRINPEDECSIEKTVDGGATWAEVFRLDSTCSLSRIIRNPADGSYGFEVEDFGFYRFPDGAPPSYVVNPPLPPPTHADTADPKCVAATNAAYVYRQLYTDIANRLLDEVVSNYEHAANVGTAITGFLMLIGAAASQTAVAISSILGVIGVRQQFLDNPLTLSDQENMTATLYDHATEHENGSVTFNFDGVWNDLALPGTKNNLVRLLLTMLGGGALNQAGAVGYVDGVDYSACLQEDASWFALGGHGLRGFELEHRTSGAACQTEDFKPTYNSFTDEVIGAHCQNGPDKQSALGVRKTFAETTFSSLRVRWRIVGDTFGVGLRVRFYNDGVLVRTLSSAANQPYSPPTDLDQTFTFANTVADELEITVFSLTRNSSIWPDNRLQAIEATGTGLAPF